MLVLVDWNGGHVYGVSVCTILPTVNMNLQAETTLQVAAKVAFLVYLYILF